MAEREDKLRELAVFVIELSGDEAYRWSKGCAAHLREKGDHARAELWENIADLVQKIQRRPERGTYH